MLWRTLEENRSVDQQSEAADSDSNTQGARSFSRDRRCEDWCEQQANPDECEPQTRGISTHRRDAWASALKSAWVRATWSPMRRTE